MNLDVSNISGQAGKDEFHRLIARILHNPPFTHHQTLPVNFALRVFPLERKSQCLRAVLTLPSVSIGRQFLREYGGNNPKNTLIMRGQSVLFRDNGTVPSREHTRHLRTSPYIDPGVLRERAKLDALKALTVNVEVVQFGWECRDGDFSVEYELRCAISYLTFDPDVREFRVKSRQGAYEVTKFIVIRGSQVQWAAYGKVAASTAVLFFSLHCAPTYEEAKPQSKVRSRLSALDSTHQRFTPYTSHSIRLICSGKDVHRVLRGLCKAAQMPNKDYVHSAHPRKLFSIPLQRQCESLLSVMPFEIAFQFDGMVRRNIIDLEEFLELSPLVKQMQNDYGVAYTASFLQNFVIQLQLQPTSNVVSLFLRYRREFVAPELPQAQHGEVFQCFHAIVTPSTIRPDGPFPERANRIIRKYADYTSHFLRVSFTDEERLLYRFDREVDGRSFIHQRFGGILHEGLTIAGRHYKFLAYSQSGLKTHSVWYVHDFDMWDKCGISQRITAASIIEGVGSFDNLEHDPNLIYCPARYAARISQAFTATEAAVTMEPEEVFIIDDIYDDAEPQRAFTDGVGTISSELAQEMWEKLQIVSPRRVGHGRPCPRAFHVRFGGSKGMLSVDYKLSGRVICIRHSMIKFDSPHRQIEVASVIDKPGRFCLNRPLVMLLEGLGAAGGYELLKRLQDDVIKDTKDSAKSLETAARLLESHGLGTSFRLTSVLLHIYKLGFNTLDDPFLKQILSFAVHHVLRDLKYHARIPVPGGWTLVGVADVHRYLREGEVFACVLPPGADEPIYMEGPMLIARSPVIHPGDAQVVHAIGHPPPGSPFEKEPLTNTVVFPVVGERPLASCLAGGDLDGDCFMCSTLQGLLPTQTFMSAEYNPAKRKMLKRPSKWQDIADFVAEYIYSDNIGIIATNWLIIADRSREGILDPDCLTLAELHSDAADYPKTGMPVPLHLIPKTKGKARPDWSSPEVRSQGNNLFYKSLRWLGKLYREVELPDVQRTQPPTRDVESDIRMLTVESVRKYLQQSRNVANRSPMDVALEQKVVHLVSFMPYKADEVNEILNLFKRPLEEAEAVVGTIVAKTSQPRMRQDCISQMREQNTSLVGDIRGSLTRCDHSDRTKNIADYTKDLRRCWIARKISTMLPDTFGAQSFGIVALGEMFDALKSIEDAEAQSSYVTDFGRGEAQSTGNTQGLEEEFSRLTLQ